MIITPEFMIIFMLVILFIFLLSGYPVAFTISGVPLVFAIIGHIFNVFDLSYVAALPNRIYGISVDLH